MVRSATWRVSVFVASAMFAFPLTDAVHLDCTGSGSPTVVFENGAGDFSMVWSLVQPGVSTFTRACSYDRAGYAWSDPGKTPRTYDQIALELFTALHRAGEHGPFVLVGQSYGGLLAREYARRYAKEVAAVLLVDAVHEDERIDMGNGTPQRIRDSAKGRARPSLELSLTRPSSRSAGHSSRRLSTRRRWSRRWIECLVICRTSGVSRGPTRCTA